MPLVVFCRVAFPLKCSVMPLKRSVFDFVVFGGVIGGVCGFRAIVGGFRAFDGCARLGVPSLSALVRPSWLPLGSVRDAFRRCARSVRP